MRSRKRTPLLLALATFLFAFTLAACSDTNLVTTTDDEASAAELNDLAARLSTDLDLTTEQLNEVNTLLTVDGRPDPGSLWTTAAALQETLTDAQKATLFEKAEERQEALSEKRRGHRFNREGQGEGRRFQRQGNRGGGFLENVLTPEQQEAMQTLRTEQREAMKNLMAAREEGSLSAEDFRTQAKALREANREAMKNLLTDEQKATLEENREAMKARFSDRKDAAQAARVEALGLTADQEVALTELRETQRAETRAFLEQARSGGVDREAMRAELQTLRASYKAAMADILTPEQLEITDIHNALIGGLADRRAKRRGGPRGFGRK